MRDFSLTEATEAMSIRLEAAAENSVARSGGAMSDAGGWVPAGVSDREVAVEGARVRYLRAGRGPALLLIHGLLGYSFSWRFNLLSLAEKFTVYAPDLPGIGFSERRPGMDGRLGAAAGRMEKFLDAAGVNDFHLLGTSHGGALAILLAARLRERVRRLVLVAPANPWSRHGRWLVPVLATGGGRALVRGVVALRSLHAWRLRQMYGDPRRIAPGTIEGYERPIPLPGTAEYVHAILRHWRSDMPRLEGALAEITDLPTLLLWGDRDRLVFPQSAQELQHRLRRAELAMFPGAGHLPYEEFPEEFNRAVTAFLVQS